MSQLNSTPSRGRAENELGAMLKFRFPLRMVVFKTCTKNQTGKQTALVRTFETLQIDVYCDSKTRVQKHTDVITTRSPCAIPLADHMSSVPISGARGHARFEIALC